MDRTKLIGSSLVGGVILTLSTGLITLRTLPGASHFGFPMAWLIRRVLVSEYFPWRIHWFGFVVDLLVWTAIVMVVLVLYDRFGS